MKFTLPVLLALAAEVYASPIESSSADTLGGGLVLRGEESILENPEIDSISAMEFVGPITPGGPDVTLSGSAKDIYEQILELNPSYDVFDFPDYAADLESQGFTRSNFETAELITRNPAVVVKDVLAKRAGDGINCDVGTWIGNVITQCSEGMNYLRKLGRARCGAKPKSCARVSCSNNCGMYYCSKFNKEIHAYCGDIANDINAIVDKCGYAYNDWILEARGRKAFTDHNVELSSASC